MYAVNNIAANRFFRLFSLCAVLAVSAFFAASAHAAVVPQTASAMGRELDRQVEERAGTGIPLYVTTPVDINNFEQSNPLARQVQEELARFFVQAGYQVQEIRKGADLLFEPSTGELLLTRKAELLGSVNVGGGAILAGTYVVTPKHVRFNIRVVSTATQEVIAMSTMSVPMSGEVAALLHSPGGNGEGGGPAYGGSPIIPTVITTLP